MNDSKVSQLGGSPSEGDDLNDEYEEDADERNGECIWLILNIEGGVRGGKYVRNVHRLYKMLSDVRIRSNLALDMGIQARRWRGRGGV